MHHPSDDLPSLETKIWRYMDLSKFIFLLEDSSLQMPNAISFEDEWEGIYPSANIRARERRIWGLNESELQDSARLRFEYDDLQSQKVAREWMFISCWHMNEYESAAMWRLFAKSDEAVALQSTVGRLVDCLGQTAETTLGPLPVYIGRVHYLDYSTEAIDTNGQDPDISALNLIMHKRRSFEHERELRVVVNAERPTSVEQYAERLKRCIAVKISLQKLIESVRVPPNSEDWYQKLIQKLLNRYGLDLKAQRSTMDAPTIK